MKVAAAIGPCVILLLALLCLSPAAVAADYKIDWYSINSGGGMVTGG